MKSNGIHKRIGEIDRLLLSLLEERRELGLEARRLPSSPGQTVDDPNHARRRLADVMAEVLAALRTADPGGHRQDWPGAAPALLDWPAF